MKRESHYLNDQIITEINEINIFIEKNDCRQLKSLNSKELSDLSKNNNSSDFSEEDILNLWQLGFLNADVVYSDKKVDINGIKFYEEKDNIYLYIDKRELPDRKNGYSDTISELNGVLSNITPLFHPFRCYVLYYIYRTLKVNIFSIQILRNSEGFESLISWHIKGYNSWTSEQEISLLFKYWNNRFNQKKGYDL